MGVPSSRRLLRYTLTAFLILGAVGVASYFITPRTEYRARISQTSSLAFPFLAEKSSHFPVNVGEGSLQEIDPLIRAGREKSTLSQKQIYLPLTGNSEHAPR